MRAWWIVVLVLCLTACDSAPRKKKARKTFDPVKLAAVEKCFNAFFEELAKGVELLQSHPKRDAIRDESTKLHDLLNQAGDAYPANQKITELVEEGRVIMRYFDGALKVANYHAAKKDSTPEKAQHYIDKTVESNLPTLHKATDMLKKDLDAILKRPATDGESQ